MTAQGFLRGGVPAGVHGDALAPLRGGDLAAQVVDLVGSAAPSSEAEVLVEQADQGLTRFANSFIHQNVASTITTTRLRLHTDGRTAVGTTTMTTRDGLTALMERTIAAARLCPPDQLWPGLAPPAVLGPAVGIDPQTAYAEPGTRAERVRAFVASAGGLETAGYCATNRRAVWFANSAGQVASAETAEAAMDGIARLDGSDGVARLAARRLAAIDGGHLGHRAAAKARAGVAAVELPPGRYEVVLEPTAVLDLLELMALHGFNGKAVTEGRSFVELGSQQFDPAISLVDDPVEAGGAALPFDVEGTPRRRLVLVDAGVSTALAHDRRSAAKEGIASTGHAGPASSFWGATPTSLHLLPEGARATAGPTVPDSGIAESGVPDSGVPDDGPAADSAVAGLVAQVRRGLLVTDNWYTRVLDPRTLVVTGLTRNGVWLIEDGRITAPVQNLRFTQSYPAALAPGAVLGVGRQSVSLPISWEAMTFRAPALRLAAWNFTGNASG
jgi:predicted Zn-dependent protease